MHIYYNCKTNRWEQQGSGGLFLGKNRLKLSKNKNIDLQHSIPFSLKRNNNQLGPLIGILSSKGSKKDFSGNRNLFIDIQKRLERTGGISFVFTPEGIKDQHILGYIYYQSNWMPVVFPIPDFIYNRIRHYPDETFKGMQPVKKLIRQFNIPYFNPHFFHKWKTYLALSEAGDIMHHLPETAELISQEQLLNWVKTHDEVYLKPVLSNRGKGIFLLSVDADTFVVTTNSSIYSFNNFEDLWDELNLDLICNKYIIQRKVALHTFEGSVYDYRVLVQRLRSDWTITGIGVRVAKKEGILTHIPNGGKIISIKELSDALTSEEIEHLVQFVATKLERAYGYIGEFSIDIGKDKNNNLWIFEVNSKPMKFDEPDIYAKQLETLIDNFYAETFFS